MNKELIKKYKKEFDHWLNGGTLLCTNDLKEWSYIVNPTFQDDNLIYIINDEYVEFRKALYEGKTVQHISATTGEWVNFNKGFEPTPSYTFLTTPEYYRIKPEESKFKVGDWVRDISPENTGIHRISTSSQLEQANLDCSYELWQPKVGDWCWYKHMLIKVISIDKRDDGIIRYVVSAPMYAEQYSGAISLEPFLGTLPSFIKDNNDNNNNTTN